jgi:hypothetical protein
MDDEACFDQLPRHQRELLEYIIEPDEPLTHATLMIGGMNPNNVKSKYEDHHHAVTGN